MDWRRHRRPDNIRKRKMLRCRKYRPYSKRRIINQKATDVGATNERPMVSVRRKLAKVELELSIIAASIKCLCSA